MNGIKAIRRYVNSRNRLNGTDCNFDFSMDLPPDIEDYTHVCVTYASIPSSYYLIAAPYNTFTLTELGVNTTVTIPPGNYTRTSFRLALPAILNAASPNGWTYSISVPAAGTQAETGLYTFTVANNAGHQPSFVFTDGLYPQFGFAYNSINNFAANTLVSTAVCSFNLEYTLMLHSNIAAGEQNNILSPIFTGGTPNLGIISYVPTDVFVGAVKFSKQKGNVFHFSLTDEDGYVLNTNGVPINFGLMIFRMLDAIIPQQIPQQIESKNDNAIFPQVSNYPSLTPSESQALSVMGNPINSNLQQQIDAISQHELFSRGLSLTSEKTFLK